ncbi:probable elongator complex protein 2 isoform X3 [Bradysia coprophila]|uniref:probable elongator complex protein 2 isoform X3 n=1 Tax=Bradysia coprophila TaxID=38358 RepID=UPI00187DB937|nr:probable elongator complex protein 2 isoform X3 [Bradysia coprophila]
MKVNNVYTSIACNRTVESADWGDNNLILFAACNSVAVFDPVHNESAKIIKTFVGHTARVNTVKWIKNRKQFISGSDDNDCIYWDIESSDEPSAKFLKGHTGAVSVVDGIYVNEHLIVATASTDSTIKFWHQDSSSNDFVCVQTISLGSGFCFAIKMFYIKNTDCVLLALATDDHNVHLYGSVHTADKREFVEIETLAGHEDWVRGLDFVGLDDGDILLASSAQDTFIRLWRISPRCDITAVKTVNELKPDEEIKIEERIFTIESEKGTKHHFAIGLESVLLGHDGWVYGVNWSRQADGTLQLLSSSIDKTLIIWTTTEDGVWMEKIRVGDVGGNSLGFYGGKFSPDGQSIMGHSFHGSFHIWRQNQGDTSSWLPGIVVGGHFSMVQDLAWEPSGKFLVTVSADQTSRIHVPWVRSSFDEHTWHELARPQVHGYDMKALAMLGRYRFASGAEEKIIRTFCAPGNFVENFRRICNISAEDDCDGTVIINTSSKGASVPSLGLSNKAVFIENEVPNEQRHIKDEYPENYFSAVTLNEPPPEETLMQNTLWPEIQKLYGHGYEIFALASSYDGRFLASSCKSNNAEHAQVIVWNTTTWKQHQKLLSHQLTVTQMKFSPNNRYLLTVSRDRRWTLFENINDSFEMIATTDKKNGIHGRIIWTCDWTFDSKYFATGSRDGKIVCWRKSDEPTNTSLKQWSHAGILEMKNDSVTALAFTKCSQNVGSEYVVAVGLEVGIIHIYGFSDLGTWTPFGVIQRPMAHHLCINKMEFKPDESRNILASCGNDGLVRLYSIKIEK